MTLPDFFGILQPLGVLIALLFSVGGFLAVRSGFGKGSAEIANQTIVALQARVEVLEAQIKSDEQELFRQRKIISTIRYALRKRGIEIQINGEYINLRDDSTKTNATIPMRIASDEMESKEA